MLSLHCYSTCTRAAHAPTRPGGRSSNSPHLLFANLAAHATRPCTCEVCSGQRTHIALPAQSTKHAAPAANDCHAFVTQARQDQHMHPTGWVADACGNSAHKRPALLPMPSRVQDWSDLTRIPRAYKRPDLPPLPFSPCVLGPFVIGRPACALPSAPHVSSDAVPPARRLLRDALAQQLRYNHTLSATVTQTPRTSSNASRIAPARSS
jgi:hypothetical protein